MRKTKKATRAGEPAVQQGKVATAKSDVSRNRAAGPKAVFAGKSGQAYITLLSAPKHGYLVRIPDPAVRGKHKHKTFAGHDQPLSALLRAAVKWRDQTYEVLYGGQTPARRFHATQSNSATAMPGIRMIVKRVQKRRRDGTVAEYEVPCVIAEVWLEPGKDHKRPRKSRSRVFSLNKYTETEALRLAAAWRQEQQEKLSSKGT